MAGKKRTAAEWRELVNDLAAEYQRATGGALPLELAARVADVQAGKAGRPRGGGLAERTTAVAAARAFLYLSGYSTRAEAIQKTAEALGLTFRTVEAYVRDARLLELARWRADAYLGGGLDLVESDAVMAGHRLADRSGLVPSAYDFNDVSEDAQRK